MSSQGILYVTMSPSSSLPPTQFHDWYNNEHGPLRLRLSTCTTGLRYQATDLGDSSSSAEKPEWMAIYDFTAVSALSEKPYTTLREQGVKTAREAETMAQISVDRRFFDLVQEWPGKGDQRDQQSQQSKQDQQNQQDQQDQQSDTNLVAVSLQIKPNRAADIKAWYADEHVSLLSAVPGWRRSRLFLASSQEATGSKGPRGEEGETELLALHEFAPKNGLGGDEFKVAVGTEWSKKILGVGGASKEEAAARVFGRRLWSLKYSFGPAPRDVRVLNDEGARESWVYSDGRTRTFAAGKGRRAAVESFVTMGDGVEVGYRLEGEGGDGSPVLVLVNSVLVDYSIWDEFVHAFLENPAFSGWRVLRFNSRGREVSTGPKSVTLDIMSGDVVQILDALRIAKADAAVGVSLGGATVLNLALKHPNRVARFVACDTNPKAPPSNPQAWNERIEMAEKENAGGDKIGKQLAEATVKRWFPEESFADADTSKRIQRVRSAVENNSLQGFRNGVKALYEYDIEGLLKNCKVKAAFVVGEKDGKLPEGMKSMADKVGAGAPLHVVGGAGHLPMVDKPVEVAKIVQDFIAS